MFSYLPPSCSQVSPHVVVCASKGGAYMLELWRRGYTTPSVMINVHPACRELPKNVPIVLVHGANDTTFERGRGISKGAPSAGSLEALVQTGSRNKCFLYFSGNSGSIGVRNGKAVRTRYGDAHNRKETLEQFGCAFSLLLYECLPRLIDAAASEAGPEVAFLESWRRFLSPERRAAQDKLGYNPEQLRTAYWQSAGKKGEDEQQLFEVAPASEEFFLVSSIFLSEPTVEPHYPRRRSGDWPSRTVLKIERIENGAQHRATDALHKSLGNQLKLQEQTLTGGVHSRWLFHGTPSEEAIWSIVKDAMSGFKMSMAGSTVGSLWGPGTYLARDAQYCFDHGFYAEADDGSCKLFLCLVETGMPCLGDPELKLDMLPFREGCHRYTSVVDSLSNPEIFCVGYSASVYPAYLIHFA